MSLLLFHSTLANGMGGAPCDHSITSPAPPSSVARPQAATPGRRAAEQRDEVTPFQAEHRIFPPTPCRR
jgi:hypothetical protein